jgi:hypothetical protein
MTDQQQLKSLLSLILSRRAVEPLGTTARCRTQPRTVSAPTHSGMIADLGYIGAQNHYSRADSSQMTDMT